MKPKITLHRTFHDVGWTYHVWKCSNETAFGFGASPQAAYRDWLAKGEKV